MHWATCFAFPFFFKGLQLVRLNWGSTASAIYPGGVGAGTARSMNQGLQLPSRHRIVSLSLLRQSWAQGVSVPEQTHEATELLFCLLTCSLKIWTVLMWSSAWDPNPNHPTTARVWRGPSLAV